MTTHQRIARRKLSLLEFAQDLGNVSRACKLVGYSRQQFHEIRRNYQTLRRRRLGRQGEGAEGPAPEPGRTRARAGPDHGGGEGVGGLAQG